VSLVASQLGFCIVYLNYVSINLHAVLGTLTNCEASLPTWGESMRVQGVAGDGCPR